MRRNFSQRILSQYFKSVVHIGICGICSMKIRVAANRFPLATRILVERCVPRKPRDMYISNQVGRSTRKANRINHGRYTWLFIACRSNIPKTSHLMDNLERCMRGEEIATSRNSSLFELIIRCCEITGSVSAWRHGFFLPTIAVGD